jgi:hypothetical protein
MTSGTQLSIFGAKWQTETNDNYGKEISNLEPISSMMTSIMTNFCYAMTKKAFPRDNEVLKTTKSNHRLTA